MTTPETLIAGAYAAFNRRDIDAALALMSEHVSWPKASEGGRVMGKEAIRAYWMRQWAEFDPRVEPLAIHVEDGGSQADVNVHQLVLSLHGDVLSDSEVRHRFTITDGLIERMDLPDEGSAADSVPSAAFSAR